MRAGYQNSVAACRSKIKPSKFGIRASSVITYNNMAKKPCKFFCEGLTCMFGQQCRFSHDDSLRQIAIEKRELADRQRDLGWDLKHDDPLIQRALLKENHIYTAVTQDWSMIETVPAEIQQDGQVGRSYGNSGKMLQFVEANDQENVTFQQFASFGGRPQIQNSKAKVNTSLTDGNIKKESESNGGEIFWNTIDSNMIRPSASIPNRHSDDSVKGNAYPSFFETEQKRLQQNRNSTRDLPTNDYLRQSHWTKPSEVRKEKFEAAKFLSGWRFKQHEESLWTREARNHMIVLSETVPSKIGPPKLQRPSKPDPDLLARLFGRSLLQSFQIFGELPTEIRLCIWKMVLRSGNNASVEVKETSSTKPHIDDTLWGDDANEEDCKFFSRYRQPILLRVCRESRELALEHYQLRFQKKIYFNYKTDAINLHTTSPDDLHRFVRALAPEELRSIQHLAISLRDTHVDNYEIMLRRFAGLKTLIIQFTLGDSEEYHGKIERIMQTAYLIRQDMKLAAKGILPRYKIPKITCNPPQLMEFP